MTAKHIQHSIRNKSKEKSRELIQTGGKRRKIRRKQNITKPNIGKYLDVTDIVVTGPRYVNI
jgi:hypothetical protein